MQIGQGEDGVALIDRNDNQPDSRYNEGGQPCADIAYGCAFWRGL